MKSGQKTYSFYHSVHLFPPPHKTEMAFTFTRYLFCQNTSKNASLVQISSSLKFGCHGWVHWLSSPRSFSKRREGWTITHFCTHSSHSPEPGVARWRGSVGSGSLLTQQCGAGPEWWMLPGCGVWNPPDQRCPARGKEPGKAETQVTKLSFCVPEGLRKRWKRKKLTAHRLHLKNHIASWETETSSKAPSLFLLLAENSTYN